MNIVLKLALPKNSSKNPFYRPALSLPQQTDALLLLKQLHEQHPNATHSYAYRIQAPDGLICRFHDAGEPGGTAGKPIFALGRQTINRCVGGGDTLFGGVKLGAGGLTRAYGNLAKQVIAQAEIATDIAYTQFRTLTGLPPVINLKYQLKKLDGSILEQSF